MTTSRSLSREVPFSAHSESIRSQQRDRILIVDDSAVVRKLFAKHLSMRYPCDEAVSANDAIGKLKEAEFALVIADIMMPGLSGIELLRKIKDTYPDTAVIIVSGIDRPQRAIDAVRLGAFDYLIKPCDVGVLELTVERALECRNLVRDAHRYKQDLEARNEELVRGKAELERLQAQIVHSEKMASIGQLAAGIEHDETIKEQHLLDLENERLKADLHAMRRGFVRALVEMLTIKDRNAYGHALRTSNYAVDIAQRLDVDQKTLKQISLAAFLHQIAYVSIPNHIRFKTDELTPEENSIVEKNFERGVKLLTGVPNFDEIASVICCLRERYDGSGSPDGLHSDQIPLQTRIIAVAAAYDEMTSMRSYQPTLSHDEAIHLLRSAAGRKLDPAVVNTFCDLIASAEGRHDAAVASYEIGHLSSEVVADFVESSAI